MSTAEDELPNADETATTATTPPPPTPPLPPPPTTTTTTATSHEKEIEKLSPEEQERALAAAQLCKNEGNEKYNLKEYDEAIDLYSKALDLTLPTDYKSKKLVLMTCVFTNTNIRLLPFVIVFAGSCLQFIIIFHSRNFREIFFVLGVAGNFLVCCAVLIQTNSCVAIICIRSQSRLTLLRSV
jgi:tetratricopeptide (TPR) repeat protein